MPYTIIPVRLAKRCVVPSPESWCDAFNDAFDPEEAAALPIFASLPAADAVGHAMRLAFRDRRLQYIDDFDGCNWWASPRSVLVRRGGQCAALSVLAASAVWLHDDLLDLAMVIGTLNRNKHAWVEGVDAAGWFLLEATKGKVFRDRPAGYTLEVVMRPGRCHLRVA